MFKLIKILNGRQNVAEPVCVTATASEAITQGEALVLSSGKATKCGATAKPTHIALNDVTATATNRKVFCIPVNSEQLYEVETSADASSNAVGTLVTLHTDGLKVTATATSGVATIVENNATASGDKIVVKF